MFVTKKSMMLHLEKLSLKFDSKIKSTKERTDKDVGKILDVLYYNLCKTPENNVLIPKFNPPLQKQISDCLPSGDITECEKCGCLIYKFPYNKGASYIQTDYEKITEETTATHEVMRTPYYCKKCKPKK